MAALMQQFSAPKPAAAASPDVNGHRSSSSSALWEGKDWGPPEIQPEDLDYLEKIGGGCFGSVYRGRCRGKEVAIKKLFRQDVDEKTLTDFKKEVHVMSQLRHPNVLLFMGACTQPGKMALVTEMMPRGNVSVFLHDASIEVSLFKRIQMAKDCALGMNWLHCSSPQILHRDLKPSNLLLDEHLNVKVCDFGLSAVKQRGEMLRDTGGIPGTPLWMAPEVLSGRPLDEKSDVYSYGIVLWEFITRKEPFEHMDSYKVFKRAICKDDERPPVPKNIPPSLTALMTQCWHKEPQVRPSFTEVLRQLDGVLVDIAIRDEAGNAFWKRALRSEIRVKWTELLTALTRGPLPAAAPLPSLHALAVEREATGDETVSLEHFGKLLAWFGPLEPGMVQRITDLLQEPWFHGPIEKHDAESKLAGKPPGTYLVRLSATSPGCFTISKVSRPGQISHQRIDYHPGRGFSHLLHSSDGNTHEVTSSASTSLKDYLHAHKQELHLDKPVECDTYKSLFVPTQSVGYRDVSCDD